MLLFIVTFLGLLFSTATSIQLQATPPSIESGLTKTLTVNCSTATDGTSRMSSVISLIISRSTGVEDTAFKELNSLNGFQPSGHVTEHLRDNQTATGIIDNNGVSYLSLVWEYPDSSNAGLYRCEAHGVDDAGHPVAINSTLLIPNCYTDATVLVGEIRNINSKMELMNDVDVKLNRTIDEIKSLVLDLKVNQQTLKGRIDSIQRLLFNDSTIYNQHHYYLSHPRATVSVKDFPATCEFFGGYLVEIDSIAEFNILRSFVAKHEEMNYVMTGATEEGHVGQWVNLHSGTVAHDIQWGPGEPINNVNASCMWFSSYTNWDMHEGHCSFVENSSIYGFLCEIPY